MREIGKLPRRLGKRFSRLDRFRRVIECSVSSLFMNVIKLLSAVVLSFGLCAGAAEKAKEKPAAAAPVKKEKKDGKAAPHVYPTMGQVDRLDPALDALIAPDAKIEKLSEGFEWA